MDADGKGRGPGNAGPGGEIVGEPREDDGVGAEGQVGGTELKGAGRNEEPSRLAKPLPRRERGHLVQTPRVVHLTPRRVGALAALAVVAVATGEWLRTPGLSVALVAAMGAGVLALAGPPRADRHWADRAVMMLALLLGAVLLGSEVRRLSLEATTPAAARVEPVLDRIGRALDQELTRLTRLVEVAPAVDLSLPDAAFRELDRLRAGTAPGAAIVLLDASGRPEVWSGRFLVPPQLAGDTMALHLTAFYAVLEVRRQRSGGGVTVSASTIWRDPAVPAVIDVVTDPVVSGWGGTLEIHRAAEATAGDRLWPDGEPMMALRATPPVRSEVVSRHRERATRAVGWLLLALLAASTIAGQRLGARLAPTFLGLVVLLRAPWGQTLGGDTVFSPAWFFSSLLGPVSSSAGQLAAVGAAALAIGAVVRHRVRYLPVLVRVAGMLLAVASPLLVRELARGITPPATGVPLSLWLGWHAGLLLPAAALLTLAAALVRGSGYRGRAAWPVVGGLVALGAAWVGVLVFTGRPGWPGWYSLLWVPVSLLVIRPAPFWASMLGVALAAGSGTALMTWGNAIAARTDLALTDVATLGGEPDPLAEPRLTDFAAQVAVAGGVPDAAQLYRAWRQSGLRRERYPTRLMVWAEDRPATDVAIDRVPLTDSVLARAARDAPPGQAIVRLADGPGVHHLLTRRLDSAHVLVVAVAPRSQLVPRAVLGRVLENHAEQAPLYRLTLTPVAATESARPRGRWRREDWSLRASRRVELPVGTHDVRIVIPLGRPIAIAVRAGLLILADVAVIALLWALWAWAAGGGVRLRLPVQRRSYETRLAITLAVFFITPAALLSAVSTRQVAGEARRSRDLVLQRVLQDAASTPEPERREGIDASLAEYRGGRLTQASEPVLVELGLMPPLLDPEAFHALVLEGDAFIAPGPERLTLTGYLAIAGNGSLEPAVLATTQSAVDRELSDRQRDLALSFALATLLGVLAAIAAARAAARTLSRPVTELRETALAFGRGHPPPAGQLTPSREFEPVFNAFDRMAADVRRGQEALEAARRRTEAVLATVPTGVVALDEDGRVLLANRTAEEMLDVPMPAGEVLTGLAPAWGPLAERLVSAAGQPDEFELESRGRRYAVRITPLTGAGGSVVSVNDVSMTTRAARVLAWADVANQVAHAIKNPLTPLRLGIQHLRRVRDERPDQFDAALEETSTRLLAEIDRLDAIARAFSRFGAPAGEDSPPEPVDARQVSEEVAALHHLGPGLAIRVEIPAGATVVSRRDELKEVLLNLCDNARNAGASEVVLRWSPGQMAIADNGRGIPGEIQSRIFEPRFSTTSSGAGLGLAVVRRLVEGWGGTIGVRSRDGQGTEFLISFAG